MESGKEMKNQRMLDELTELMRIDVSSGQETEIAEHLVKKLEQMGFAITRDEAGATFGGVCGNILAVREGERDGVVCFCSHMDRVLMFGNLIKEIGADTSRLFDAAANSIMNAATIFLGLSVGATMTSEAFLNWTTIGIVIGGFLAFALSITGGIFFVKLFNLFSKKKINPLIGATGLSAVPMASLVGNDIATK